jgi:hypothetical protein
MDRLMKVLENASLAVVFLCTLATIAPCAQAAKCVPTPWDEIGPFYRPNAPARGSIGKGYLLSGTVRSSADCSPIPKARIEVWQTGPGGKYDEAHRATLVSDREGRYRLETDFPPGYAQWEAGSEWEAGSGVREAGSREAGSEAGSGMGSGVRHAIMQLAAGFCLFDPSRGQKRGQACNHAISSRILSF